MILVLSRVENPGKPTLTRDHVAMDLRIPRHRAPREAEFLAAAEFAVI
jgi:hypothetical protein